MSDENESPEEKVNPDKPLTIFTNNYRTSFMAPCKDTKKSKHSASTLQDKDIRKTSTYTIDNDYDSSQRFNTTHIGWTGRLEYAVQRLKEETLRNNKHSNEQFRDANYLLEITISTIMLMAMNATVPDENYVYTSLYLKTMKNDVGEYPPNIGKILHLIRKATREKNIDWGGNKSVENNSRRCSNVDIKKTRGSRIPVRSSRTISDSHISES